MELTEKLRLKYSVIFPLALVSIMWIVRIVETWLGEDFDYLGIYPRQVIGLLGIFTAPFIHADFNHLFNNSIPLLILGIALFYFYRGISGFIFLLIYLITGLSVWIFGRPSFHIGASGVVYGLASFLFFSGIIRNDLRLLSVALVVVFLYGGLVWGILPVKTNISWESHMLGAFIGLLLALAYRNRGPEKPLYPWSINELESDDIQDFEDSDSEINELEDSTNKDREL